MSAKFVSIGAINNPVAKLSHPAERASAFPPSAGQGSSAAAALHRRADGFIPDRALSPPPAPPLPQQQQQQQQQSSSSPRPATHGGGGSGSPATHGRPPRPSAAASAPNLRTAQPQASSSPLTSPAPLPLVRGQWTAAGSLLGPAPAQRHAAATGPEVKAAGPAAEGSVQQVLQAAAGPTSRRLGSAGSGHWSSSSGGGGGGGSTRPGTTSSMSSVSSSSYGTPAGAAVTAVRAAAARSASAPSGAVTASTGGGSGTGLGSTSTSRQPQRAVGVGRSGSGSGGRGQGGGCSAAGAAASAASGGGVSGLPLERQVAHYAQAGAAAAAEADAVKAAMALHLLNGCFLRATGGYEGTTALAAAAAAAAPGLAAALVEAVSEGAPQSLVAYNTLSYLALSAEVVPRLLSCGLVAVLVGQLRAAATAPLEQQLLVSGLGLLVTMTRVSADARARLAVMRGVAAALAAALGHPSAAVRAPALQLVQELVLTRKGLDQLRSCQALLAALDRLSEEEPQGAAAEDPHTAGGGGRAGEPTRGSQHKLQAQLQRQARLARATIRALAVVMK
ncbi:hypothetical protein PLESTM_000886600 [Pleodorina starrii]|nr:hypothetical protein PLESTM_000886600 [Pleodorina starrii]